MKGIEIMRASEWGLKESCHSLVEQYYVAKYGISLGVNFDLQKKVDPYPDDYFMALKAGAVVGCCGVYDSRDKVLRFREEVLPANKSIRYVELTKLVVPEAFRNQNLGSLLTASALAYCLEGDARLLLHASVQFVERILAVLDVEYEVLMEYPADSAASVMYGLKKTYLIRVLTGY